MNHYINFVLKIYRPLFSAFLSFVLITTILGLPFQANAAIADTGKHLFEKHCSACHINGGNIIRRNKTLRLAALKRAGIDNPKEIAKIAISGIGIMSGYAEVLNEEEAQIISNWIWDQAQNAWIQG